MTVGNKFRMTVWAVRNDCARLVGTKGLRYIFKKINNREALKKSKHYSAAVK